MGGANSLWVELTKACYLQIQPELWNGDMGHEDRRAPPHSN